MKFYTIVLYAIILFGLQGCFFGTSSYYVLSVPSTSKTHYTMSKNIIAVEKVTVPGYLYKRNIAIATSSSQIKLLGNAQWGEDLDSGLTNRLISYLQKKFNHPGVYLYPWGIDKQPDVKISVQITRFIAKADAVYLDATWSVEDMKQHRRISRLFSTHVATTSNVDTIVSSMDKAFGRLEKIIANGVKHF